MVSELPAWTRLWCVMRQNTLRCWQYPEDVGRKMPMHTFNFTEVNKSCRLIPVLSVNIIYNTIC